MIGERVGDWTVEAEVACDDRSRVYRVRSALKPESEGILTLLHSSTYKTPDFLELFRGRLIALLKLDHPALVRYLASGIVHGDPYYVTEAVEGATYETLLRDGQKPTWQEVMQAALPAMSALRYSHRRGILHGDLRPGNLWRLPDGSIKVGGAGLSRLFDNEMPTFGSNALGPPAFMSPERASGKTITKRSDFYSFGCLLYALTTGRPPFTMANVMELVHKHSFVLPDRPIHFIPDLPEELDALIMKLLVKDPQMRPGSGTMIIEELERIWAAHEARGKLPKRPVLPVEGPEPLEKPAPAKPLLPRPVSKPPKPLLKRPYVIIPAFLVVVSALGFGFYWTQSAPEDLFARAEPLMRSDDPNDWEKAWSDYLEPLSRRYPDRYVEEIKAFRGRVEPFTEWKRVSTAGRATKFSSEGERFYVQGLRLTQAGDFAGAKKCWERVVTAFAQNPNEARWVDLSRVALARSQPQMGVLHRPEGESALRTALDKAKLLMVEGKKSEADALWKALEELYRDDQDGAEVREMIRKERGS